MTLITNIAASVARPYEDFQTSLASWLRPNTTGAYGDNDVMSQDAVATQAIVFDNVGGSGKVMTAVITLAPQAAATMGFDLHLFSTEPTNHADNAAFTPGALDIENYIGMIPFADGNKRAWATGFQWMATAMNPIPFVASANKLYGLLVVRGTPTPTGFALVTVKLGIERQPPLGRR